MADKELTIEFCDDNVHRLWQKYMMVDPEKVTKKEELLTEIDTWLDTRLMLTDLALVEGGVPVGG